ncbi:MAG: hypothetical protein FJ035_06780, partial [Chloroflexi bacterium]|nr:hypothetical protein [Chloroflexota bacterium]
MPDDRAPYPIRPDRPRFGEPEHTDDAEFELDDRDDADDDYLDDPFGEAADDELDDDAPAARAYNYDDDREYAAADADARARAARRETFAVSRDSGARGRFARVAMLIASLAAVIAVLIAPPISILDRGDDETVTTDGIVIRARGSVPGLPHGLEAASALYDIEAPADFAGPANLTVRLSEPAEDTRALAFYTHRDGQWQRLGSVTPAEGGRYAKGELGTVPANIAVLRRTAYAHALGIILAPGQTPDPGAGTPSVASVLGATPGASDDGLQLSDAVSAGLDGRYLGITTSSSADAAAVNRILGEPTSIRRHIDAIVAAARATRAKGVHVDYSAVEPSRRAALSSLVAQLGPRLRADGRGLVVTVPTPAGTDPGAYDWPALTAAADAIWLRGPSNPAAYYDQLEAALRVRRDAGTELAKVSLVVDRRSREKAGDSVQPLTLYDALALASTLRLRQEQGIFAGEAVTVSGVNIDEDSGNSGLRWDERAKAVSFAYAGRGGPRTVWIENRFSLAFRLEVARRFGLGVVVEAAGQDAALPDVWNTVLGYAADGGVHLELPYGPYLRPTFRAAQGTIKAGEHGAAVWRAPAQPGLYDVTLVVSDGVVFVGQQLGLRVAAGTPTPTTTASTTTSVPTAATTTRPAATATATPRPATATVPAATATPTARPPTATPATR